MRGYSEFCVYRKLRIYWERSSLLVVCCLSLVTSAARSIPTINAERAKEAAREQVVWNGRLCPLSTPAHHFLQTIYGKSSYKGLSPEQVFYGWLLRPDAWKNEPMIHITDDNLRQQLGIGSDYACFAELFDDTLGYKVNQLGAGLPEHMRPFVKEMPSAVELDEKVGLIILLTQGRLVQPRPADMEPLTAVRVEAEILYNRIPNALLLTILFFVIVGGGMLVWRARRPGSSGTPKRSGK